MTRRANFTGFGSHVIQSFIHFPFRPRQEKKAKAKAKEQNCSLHQNSLYLQHLEEATTATLLFSITQSKTKFLAHSREKKKKKRSKDKDKARQKNVRSMENRCAEQESLFTSTTDAGYIPLHHPAVNAPRQSNDHPAPSAQNPSPTGPHTEASQPRPQTAIQFGGARDLSAVPAGVGH